MDIRAGHPNEGCGVNRHSTRRSVSVVGLIVATLMAGAGCGDPPTKPSLSSTPTPTPTPKDSAAASYVIENAFAIVHPLAYPLGSGFGYEVRFLLRETTGRGSAIVEEVAVAGPNGTDLTGPGCWHDDLRVPAGGTLDTFYTDAGSSWLGYCGPGSGGSTPTPSLTIKVTLNDGTAFTIQQQVVSLR